MMEVHYERNNVERQELKEEKSNKESEQYRAIKYNIIIHCLKSNIQEAQWTILTTQKKNIKL